MNVMTRVRLFRICSWLTYPLALVLIYPLSALKKKNPSGLFFFFDRYCIGGAQKVFLDILRAVGTEYKVVYFTRKPADVSLKSLFFEQPNAEVKDISFWTSNVPFRLFAIHYHAFYINRHQNACVLGSNSTFFHDAVPFLNGRVRKIDLLHNFLRSGKKGFEFFGLANYRYLDKRVVVDTATIENIREQYHAYHVPPAYLNRVLMIETAVDIPRRIDKDFSPPLKVLCAGRGGPQKRVWLISRIAEYFVSRPLPVEFHFAGTMMDELSEITKKSSIVHGPVTDRAKLDEIYSASHAVLLTSAYEGSSMVIKEGMAHGCVPIVTELPVNKKCLTERNNALFIHAVDDEQAVVELGIARIKDLLADPALLRQLSEHARAYALEHFGMERFRSEYRRLLLP